MRFTHDLTPDVNCVKNDFDNLESCVGCVIHESPQLFQIIELGKCLQAYNNNIKSLG